MSFEKRRAVIGLSAPARYKHHRFSADITAAVRDLKSDNWHGILYILKEYAVIGAFCTLTLAVSWWFYPLAVLMIGAHQRGISTILHDSAHGVLARNRLLNFLLGTFPTAWPIFQRHFAYKKSHVNTHHPYLGRPDSDPDLQFFIEEGVFTPRTGPAFVWHVVVLPMLGSKIHAYLKYLVRNRYRMIVGLLKELRGAAGPRREEEWRVRFDRVGFLVFWCAIVGAAIVFDWWLELVAFWIVPYLTSFHILGWFIEMSEHCSSIEGETVNVHMARNRRSRHVEKLLTGINNDDYHLDHHLDPSTPFWRLPEAHAIRMRDPVYAAHCNKTGGIFQDGPDGEPSIIRLIWRQNNARYALERPAPAGTLARS